MSNPSGPPPVKGYYMSDVKIGIPASQIVRALWDTGAMPTLICESILPLGTALHSSSIRISGVSNRPITIKGEANVYIQVGNKIVQQLMVVVPIGSMQFPEKSKIILGANFISQFQLVIDSSTWNIVWHGEIVMPLLPAVIDEKLYAPSVLEEPLPKPLVPTSDDSILLDTWEVVPNEPVPSDSNEYTRPTPPLQPL